MKISNKILLGLLAAVVLHIITGMVIVRGSLAPGGIGNGDNLVEGNGITKKVDFPIDDFEHIMIEGNYKVELSQGTPSAAIEGDENLMEYLDFGLEGDGKTLSIKAKKGYTLTPKNGIILHISFEHLESISSYGFCNFHSDQALNFEDLEIHMHGAGMVDFPLTANTLELQINGSCETSFTGTVNLLEANISGVGQLNANGLVAKKADLQITGSGTANVNVTEYLDASTSGSSYINYSGNPKVDMRTSGASRISKL